MAILKILLLEQNQTQHAKHRDEEHLNLLCHHLQQTMKLYCCAYCIDRKLFEQKLVDHLQVRCYRKLLSKDHQHVNLRHTQLFDNLQREKIYHMFVYNNLLREKHLHQPVFLNDCLPHENIEAMLLYNILLREQKHRGH